MDHPLIDFMADPERRARLVAAADRAMEEKIAENFKWALIAIGDDIEDDLFADAVIDGIRFGARAAVSVELAGGAMVRFIMPGGERITSEWATHADAEDQIKAAMVAIYAERTSAEGVGE